MIFMLPKQLRKHVAAIPRMLARFAVFLIACSPNYAACGDDDLLPATLRLKFDGVRKGNINYVVCRGGNLVLTGEIKPDLPDLVTDCLARDKTVRTVYVDLLGGDVAAALKIAQAIDRSGVAVVVDGRCFSACADYLLPSARKVSVLPGSLVGIHDRLLQIRDSTGKTVREHLTNPEAQLRKWGQPALTAYRKTELERLNFLGRYGRSEPFHDIFRAYLGRQASFLWGKAADSFLCPKYEIWILDQAQLKEFGLRAIEDVWAPSSQKQVDAITRSWRHSEQFFFGTASLLDRQCTIAGVFAW